MARSLDSLLALGWRLVEELDDDAACVVCGGELKLADEALESPEGDDLFCLYCACE